MALAKRIIAAPFIALALIATLALALCAYPPSAHADEGGEAAASADAGSVGEGLQGAWHTWHPNPGDTVDVSNASWNTTVQINKAGEYRLTGKSTNVRVVIKPSEGQAITVKLADGLNIDPSITSNIGVRTSAIEIGESKDATVKLVSEAGAQTYFGSYLLCPAIRKDGTSTKLVFETEDPGNPGTIAANASYSSCSAGIGSVYVLSYGSSGTTGNIEINSGRVVAKGGNGGAGIGGGCRGSAQNITINGGTVEAEGFNGGAGIGGGYGRNGKDITINSGDILAVSVDGGAAIGGGKADTVLSSSLSRGENIRINGGDVTARADGDQGAGIGAGGQGLAQGIRISGGKVDAEASGAGAGIGAGGGKESGATDIYISGGDITAKGGVYAESNISAGIGGNFYQGRDDKGAVKPQMNIVISGGIVNATGQIGIGAIHSGDAVYGNVKTNITISGGTITAKGLGLGNFPDIGYYNNKGCTTTISGGSVNAERVVKPVDKWGKTVGKTTVAIGGAADGTPVASIDLSGSFHADVPYGTNDVHTIGNLIYPWINSNNSVTSATDSSGAIYTGKVSAGGYGTLRARPNIALDANAPSGSTGYTNGSAYVRSYATLLSSVGAPTAPGKLVLIGYGTTADPNAEGAKLVADAGGSLVRSVDGYTDENGRWVHQMDPSGKATLYAWWHEPAYTVAFDANVPSTASTQVTGSMDSATAKVGETITLEKCGFSLPGYSFTGWSTAADGSGKIYADGAQVSNLSEDDGATVTLYAQWEPLAYKIELTVDDGQGGWQTQEVSTSFDKAVELEWSGAIPDNRKIVGWSGLGFGSFYAYGSKIANLCRLDQDGTLLNTTVSLNAVLADDGVAYLTITNNGAGVTLDDPSKITLAEKDGAASYTPFTKTVGNGVYSTDPNAASQPGSATLPDGTYTVSIEGWDTRGATIEIANGAGMLSLEYFTVEVLADDHASAWIDSAGTASIEHCLAGDALEIGASTDVGYAFESWTAGGVTPDWQSNDPTLASQAITLNGSVVLQAHAAASVYTVAFDANANDAAGIMENQDMVYGEPQNLFANGFSRDGYDFAGWTTTPEWTGTLYADCQSVQDLAADNGVTVTLYAQWSPHAYYVHFDPNGANTVDADEVLDQKLFHDQSQDLLPCMFELDGFHFTGWNTEADGSGTQFADGATVAENLADENGGSVTLYAQWERDCYTVVFDPNGGTGEMEPQRVEIGLGEPLDDCQFTREGYEFIGWNTAPGGSGASYQPGATLEEDLAEAGGTVTLYAQWEETPKPDPEPEPEPVNPNDGSDDNASQKKLAGTGDEAAGAVVAHAAIALAACVTVAGAWRRTRR